MRRFTVLAAFALLLAACGQDEPAEPAVDDALPADAAVVEEAPDGVGQDTAPADEALEVVEESAAEPEPEEETIVLAQADPPKAPADWKFREGQHYDRLVPTQPTVGGADKIEVAEFFWYGCPHCYDLEPIINAWAADLPPNVRFVRVPATWNNLLVMHAKLFYTEEILVRNGVITDPPAFRQAVFREYHERGNRLTSEGAIQKLFERYNVSAEEFNRTWNSFEVAQKMRVAQDLMRRYGVASVPVIIVNGKYRTGNVPGGFPALMELVDELVLRESLR